MNTQILKQKKKQLSGCRILLIFFVVSALTLLYSCSDDNVTGSNPTYYIVTSLNGTVNNLASNARDVRAKVTREDSSTFLAGNCFIGTDNIMNINLTAPPADFLGSINLLFVPLGISNISISDASAKGNYVTLYVYDSVSAHFAGDIIRANTPDLIVPTAGNFYINYFYSDRNVSVTGTDSRIAGSDTTKYTFNMLLGTGYNKVTTKVITTRTNYVEIEIASGEPSGANWYYIPFTP